MAVGVCAGSPHDIPQLTRPETSSGFFFEVSHDHHHQPDITDGSSTTSASGSKRGGCSTHISRGERRTIIGCIGDETLLQRGGAALAPRRGDRSCRCSSRTSSRRGSSSAMPTVVRVGEGDGSDHWRRRDRRDRRPVLGREPRDAAGDRARRARRRRDHAARRRVQAAHVAVRVPGTRRGGAARCSPRCARRPACPS